MSLLDESIAAVARLTELLVKANTALLDVARPRARRPRAVTGNPVGRPRGVKHPLHDPGRAERPPGRPRLSPPIGSAEFVTEMARRRRVAYEKRKQSAALG